MTSHLSFPIDFPRQKVSFLKVHDHFNCKPFEPLLLMKEMRWSHISRYFARVRFPHPHKDDWELVRESHTWADLMFGQVDHGQPLTFVCEMLYYFLKRILSKIYSIYIARRGPGRSAPCYKTKRDARNGQFIKRFWETAHLPLPLSQHFALSEK